MEDEEQDRELVDDIHVIDDGEEGVNEEGPLFEEDVVVQAALERRVDAGIVQHNLPAADPILISPTSADLLAVKEKFGQYVLITKGQFANHLARLDRRCHQSTRYSLTVLSDAAEEMGVKNPKLIASSFVQLPVCIPSELPSLLQDLRARLFSPMSPSGRSKLTLQSKVKEKSLDGDDST